MHSAMLLMLSSRYGNLQHWQGKCEYPACALLLHAAPALVACCPHHVNHVTGWPDGSQVQRWRQIYLPHASRIMDCISYASASLFHVSGHDVCQANWVGMQSRKLLLKLLLSFDHKSITFAGVQISDQEGIDSNFEYVPGYLFPHDEMPQSKQVLDRELKAAQKAGLPGVEIVDLGEHCRHAHQCTGIVRARHWMWVHTKHAALVHGPLTGLLHSICST